MRETTRNRRLTMTNNMMQFQTSVEYQRNGTDMMSMEWKDWGDFYKKYDSTVNPDNYAKRISIWDRYENLGLQCKMGLLDMEIIYVVSAVSIINTWIKFRPIIEEYRKLDYGRDMFVNWEYLVTELAKMKAERDPSWKGSKSYIKLGEYDKTFNK